MRSSNSRSVDASLEAVAQHVRKTAAARIDVFPHAAPPLEVIGFSRIKNTAGPLVQLKEEGERTRTNWVGGFVAYFSEQQVHIFTTETCITAPAQAEKTVEFLYEDVVSLATESDQRGSRLSLTVRDGSRYDAPISDVAVIWPPLGSSYGDDDGGERALGETQRGAPVTSSSSAIRARRRSPVRTDHHRVSLRE